MLIKGPFTITQLRALFPEWSNPEALTDAQLWERNVVRCVMPSATQDSRISTVSSYNWNLGNTPVDGTCNYTQYTLGVVKKAVIVQIRDSAQNLAGDASYYGRSMNMPYLGLYTELRPLLAALVPTVSQYPFSAGAARGRYNVAASIALTATHLSNWGATFADAASQDAALWASSLEKEMRATRNLVAATTAAAAIAAYDNEVW